MIFIRNILENSDDEGVNEAEDAVSEDSGWGNLFLLFSGQLYLKIDQSVDIQYVIYWVYGREFVQIMKKGQETAY